MTPFILPRPKHVNRDKVFPVFDLPFDPEASPTVQPMWGRAVHMLVSGGCWNPTDNPTHWTTSKGAPRRTRADEPEPWEANEKSTMSLVRAVWRAGGTPWQAEQILSDLDFVGGALYRYSKRPQRWLMSMWEEVTVSDTDSYYSSQVTGALTGEGSCNSPFERGGLLQRSTTNQYREGPSPAEEAAILEWLRLHPGQAQHVLIDACVGGVHPRVIRRYLADMKTRGLIEWSHRRLGGPGGPAKVWSLVDPVVAVKAKSEAVRAQRQSRDGLAARLREALHAEPAYERRQYDPDVTAAVAATLAQVADVARLGPRQVDAWAAVTGASLVEVLRSPEISHEEPA